VIAAMMKDLEMLKILMTKQFNVNHKNYDGNTALHYACAMSCQKVIDFLISKGAREDIENSLG
jgi:ankyrin repeat protein